LLTVLQSQSHGSQRCVHFQRVDNTAGINLAYYSFCTRMGERCMENTQKIFIPVKLTSANVVFTFNASAISLTPSSSNRLSISQQIQSLNISGTCMNERKIQIKLPLKLRQVSVVFTFNTSAR